MRGATVQQPWWIISGGICSIVSPWLPRCGKVSWWCSTCSGRLDWHKLERWTSLGSVTLNATDLAEPLVWTRWRAVGVRWSSWVGGHWRMGRECCRWTPACVNRRVWVAGTPVGVHGIVPICGISSNRKIYLRFGVGWERGFKG